MENISWALMMLLLWTGCTAGKWRKPGGKHATSGQALKNLLKFTGRPLEEIIPMLTENPAKLIRVYDRVGSIEEGKAANLVALDEECNVCRTYVKGMLVYEK